MMIMISKNYRAFPGPHKMTLLPQFFFDSLLLERQGKVLSMLAEEDLERVGAFYKSNSQQFDFLQYIITVL